MKYKHFHLNTYWKGTATDDTFCTIVHRQLSADLTGITGVKVLCTVYLYSTKNIITKLLKWAIPDTRFEKTLIFGLFVICYRSCNASDR